MEESSQNFGHQHPLLLLLNEDQQISNQSGVANCSRCGEKVSAPCFSCVEYCGFYLHNICAEAPREINHPFHRRHPLVLLQRPLASCTWCVCDFCGKECEKFIYHCSCKLDFLIKCALFTFNIAEKNLKELEHVAHKDPLISTENDEKHEDLGKCFGCWESLAKYTYFSLDCGFNLHKKCAELPLKINHMCHRKHFLILQFNNEPLSCKICQETQAVGFVYCCSPCKIVVHIECLSSSPTDIKDRSHKHPFTLFWRQSPFICDACGTEGNCAAYICCTCNIIVHKKCILLPQIIRSKWYDHCIYHTYFLQEEDFKSWNCIICHDEVSTGHGNYCCSICNITFHVNCVTKNKYSYSIVSLENEDEKSRESFESIACVFQRNNVGKATEIKHFKHIHNVK